MSDGTDIGPPGGGAMRALLSPADLLPGFSIALVTLLAALPWGLPSEARFLLPLLPFAAIHYWALSRPGSMPEWQAFLSGLATDALTHGPLGFWSLVFLVGFILSGLLPRFERWGAKGRWLHFCATLLLLSAVQWAIASAYFLGAADWRPLMRGALLAALLYPLIELLLRPIDRLSASRFDARFERGA